MLKYILILFFAFLLASCSNLHVEPIEEKDKIMLSKELDDFKYYLKKGDIERVDSFISDNIKKRYIIKELESSDFSNVDIFHSTPSFRDNKAYNIVALSYNDKTVYFEVEYKFLNGKWKITNIQEKGE